MSQHPILVSKRNMIIPKRRELVARYRRLGYSGAAISEVLANEHNEVNPDNGLPWNPKTICDDINVIQAQAKAMISQTTLEHRAEIHQEYVRLWNEAASNSDIDTILKVLKALREMHGIDSPQVVILEQIQTTLIQSLDRIDLAFADRPELKQEIIRALIGDIEVFQLPPGNKE